MPKSKKMKVYDMTYKKYRQLCCSHCDCPECSGRLNSKLDECAETDVED